MSSETFKNLAKQAEAQMSAYPQYRNHFEGYVLVRIKRDVKTKLGQAFRQGEYAIAQTGTQASEFKMRRGKPVVFRTVWSMSNRIDTSVEDGWVEVL